LTLVDGTWLYGDDNLVYIEACSVDAAVHPEEMIETMTDTREGATRSTSNGFRASSMDLSFDFLFFFFLA